jgi:hypothetical protein
LLGCQFTIKTFPCFSSLLVVKRISTQQRSIFGRN